MVSKSAPQAPDPTSTIAAQDSSNTKSALQNAELNRINQNTPYGSSTYTTDGTYEDGTPKYTQTTTLAPAQQQLLDLGTQGATALGNTAVGMLGQVQDAYSKPIDTSGVPSLVSNAGGDYSAAQKQAQDAAYAKNTEYLDPQFAQGQNRLDNSLINQGITQGSEAYNTAQGNFGLQKQAAYDDARNSAIAQGNQEQNTLFGQDLSNANLNNSTNAQSLQQLFALRNQPLNEYSALASGSQVTNPTFSSTPQANVATTNSSGIINQGYQNQLAQAQQQNQGINNLFSLGGSLGSAAILASDRRLKRDIVRVGTTHGGIPTYTFRYNNDNSQVYYGVMADEVMHIPGAAVLGKDGFYGVNYSVVP